MVSNAPRISGSHKFGLDVEFLVTKDATINVIIVLGILEIFDIYMLACPRCRSTAQLSCHLFLGHSTDTYTKENESATE